MTLRLLVCTLLLPISACAGSTGGNVVEFRAAAVGVEPGPDGALEFDNSTGFHVRLERASLHVGAIYLNESVPSSGAQATACTLPGIYVAEVLAPLDIDLLSAERQYFSQRGEGTTTRARAAEVWLGAGAIDDSDDDGVILDTSGSAEKDGTVFPFEAAISIGKNRAIAASDPALPGANPICKQRIVSPIAVELTPRAQGVLLLSVDARAFFRSVDFSALPKLSDQPLLYRFADAATNAADINLFAGLRARSAAYRFSWK